jgi:hypothetical protein
MYGDPTALYQGKDAGLNVPPPYPFTHLTTSPPAALQARAQAQQELVQKMSRSRGKRGAPAGGGDPGAVVGFEQDFTLDGRLDPMLVGLNPSICVI